MCGTMAHKILEKPDLTLTSNIKTSRNLLLHTAKYFKNIKQRTTPLKNFEIASRKSSFLKK